MSYYSINRWFAIIPHTHALNAEECHISCITPPWLPVVIQSLFLNNISTTSSSKLCAGQILHSPVSCHYRADRRVRLRWWQARQLDFFDYNNLRPNRRERQKMKSLKVCGAHFQVLSPVTPVCFPGSYLKTCHSSRLPSQLSLIPLSRAGLSRSAPRHSWTGECRRCSPNSPKPCVTELLIIQVNAQTRRMLVRVCVLVLKLDKEVLQWRSVCQSTPAVSPLAVDQK